MILKAPEKGLGDQRQQPKHGYRARLVVEVAPPPPPPHPLRLQVGEELGEGAVGGLHGGGGAGGEIRI